MPRSSLPSSGPDQGPPPPRSLHRAHHILDPARVRHRRHLRLPAHAARALQRRVPRACPQELGQQALPAQRTQHEVQRLALPGRCHAAVARHTLAPCRERVVGHWEQDLYLERGASCECRGGSRPAAAEGECHSSAQGCLAKGYRRCRIAHGRILEGVNRERGLILALMDPAGRELFCYRFMYCRLSLVEK